MDFPNTPFIGQTYVLGTRSWQWNGEGWVRVINAGQIVSVLVSIDYVYDTAAGFPSPITTTWTLLNYI